MNLHPRISVILGLGCAIFLAAGSAMSQQYPTRAIRLVHGFTPGGISDLLARTLGAKLTESMHQQVLVEPRPGAGTTIASEFIAKSPPDGYTVFLQDITTHAINAVVTGNTAKTAFLVTKGHGDMLVFREGGRIEPFNFTVPYPDPYVPRWLTYEIPERVLYDGRVMAALEEEGLARDFIRLVQVARKDAGFRVTDRIVIEVKADGPVRAALEAHRSTVMGETLAVGLHAVEGTPAGTVSEGTVQDAPVTLGVRVAG